MTKMTLKTIKMTKNASLNDYQMIQMTKNDEKWHYTIKMTTNDSKMTRNDLLND